MSAKSDRQQADDLAAAVQALQDIMAAPERAAEIAEKALAEVMMRRMGVAPVSEGRVLVRIPAMRDGEVGWAKWVMRVDPSERGGFMFDGPFLRLGQPAPLPVGAVVMIAVGTQSGQKRSVNRATAFVVQPNGADDPRPVTAPRGAWGELAAAIGAYLSQRRDAPLLAVNQNIPPPVPIPSPATTAADPFAAADAIPSPAADPF